MLIYLKHALAEIRSRRDVEGQPLTRGMERIAVPMFSSTLLTLIVIPALFGLVKGFRLSKEDRYDDKAPPPAARPIERSQLLERAKRST